MSITRAIAAVSFVVVWTVFVHSTDVQARISLGLIAAGLLIFLASDTLDRGDPL